MGRKEPHDGLKLKHISFLYNYWNVYTNGGFFYYSLAPKQSHGLLQISAYSILMQSLFWLRLINAMATFSSELWNEHQSLFSIGFCCCLEQGRCLGILCKTLEFFFLLSAMSKGYDIVVIVSLWTWCYETCSSYVFW